MDVEFLRNRFEDGYYGVITKHKLIIGVRHIQIFYMLVSSIVIGLVRGSVGVAVLAINDASRRNDTYIQIHHWNKTVQGAVLSSFFFGYALILFPAGVYLRRAPGRLLLTAVLLVNGILCSAMPTIVNKGGWIAACNAQLLLGMVHGCYSITYEILLEKWLPPSEKQIFTTIIYGGVQLGVIIAFPASAFLLSLPLGWELIYYSLAMITLAMAVVVGTLTASSPQEHQAIGEKELDYILDSLNFYRKKILKKPWRAILRSPQFWAVAGAQAASNALFVFCLVYTPTYLCLFFLPLKDSTFYSMLPFMSTLAVYWGTAPTLEWISKSGFVGYICSNTFYRKFLNCLGATGIVLALVVLPSCYDILSVTAAFTSILGLLGFQFSGFLSNIKDMSENYGGTVMLMTSTVSSFVGAAVPFIFGVVLGEDPTNPLKWRCLFITLASFYALMGFIYTVFGSNDRQAWDYDDNKKPTGHYNSIINDNLIQLEELSNVKSQHRKQEIDTSF